MSQPHPQTTSVDHPVAKFPSEEATNDQTPKETSKMAASEPYYRHTPIDSARGEIRVLVILTAPADQPPPVSCRVEVRTLASNPEYDAISYTRLTSTEDDNNSKTPAGDEPEEQTTIILVDGAPFRVPTNAAAALQYLGQKSTSSRLTRVWIDCVCINQEDPSDKARQILLMGRTYRQARRVCVWLGSTALCEENLRTLHPWWTRLWVVQEAVLAKRLVFMDGGGVELTWRAVEKQMMRRMTTGDGGGRKDCNFGIIRRAREGYEHHGNWDPSVHALLYAVSGLGCAKPEDRIYAVLGLVPKLLDLGVVPAYDAPVARPRLYADLVRETIKETGNLEVLNCVREWRRGDGVDGTMLGLPSWAPNWSVRDSHDPEPLVDLFKPSGAPGRYSAARLLDAKLGKNPEGSTLVLGGIRFDEVMQLGGPWCSDGSPIWRRDHAVLAGWADIALSPRPLCPYTNGGDDPDTPSEGQKEALLRTYIADYTSEGESAPREHLETYVEAWCDRARWTPNDSDDTLETYLQQNLVRQPRSTKSMATAAKPKQKDGTLIRAALGKVYPAYRHKAKVKAYQIYIERIERACSNRQLLVTKRGHIGLAPWNAQVGDVVAVLHGGDTPFLLRPACSEPGVYSFVGEAFVHGIMGGEALAWENAAAAAREFRIV